MSVATRSPNAIVRNDHQCLRCGEIAQMDILDAGGRVLVATGTRIDDDKLHMIRKRSILGFYTESPWGSCQPAPSADTEPTESASEHNSIQPSEADQVQSTPPGCLRFATDSLKPGMRLYRALYDDRGVLLLAANTTLTPRLLSLLRQRDLTSVFVNTGRNVDLPDELLNYQSAFTERLDRLLETMAGLRPKSAHAPWYSQETLEPADIVRQARADFSHYENATRKLEENMDMLAGGSSAAAEGVSNILLSFVDSIALDLNILPFLIALKSTPHEYLYQHALDVSLLSMTIAARMGYSREQTHHIGLGAMLHDTGMLKISGAIRRAPRTLSAEEFLQVQFHPMYTLDILEPVTGIDDVVKLISYQVHERNDHSGYPKGRGSRMIHPYAQIIAVADTYCAMTEPRPYREAFNPYQAMVAVLGQTRFGSFTSRVVRALLDSVSLFPVGSIVHLNNDRLAQVIRSHTAVHTKPVVRLLDSEGRATKDIVDLRSFPQLAVVRVVK